MMEATHLGVLPAGVLTPPGEDDLPCDDGMPMETQRHYLQMVLLIDALSLHWEDRDDVFVAGNMFVYYSLEQAEEVVRELGAEAAGRGALPPEKRAFRDPDFFAVLDVPRRERKSWVIWEEGKGPDVVIELLSSSTAAVDKGKKKRVYQDLMRVPEYFWYDPFSTEWAGFGLTNGVYEPREPDEAGRLISRKLDLALVRWDGEYKDVEARWLRWETLEGELLPTAREMAEEERRRADNLAAELARYREHFGELPEE